MKKFIVWDNISKTFRNDFKDFVGLNTKGQLYSFKHTIEMQSEYSIYWDIGLKDINKKSIYADSSIVEYGIQKWKVIYNVFQMSYELECILNKSLSNMRLTGAYQNQLKIIDTIQENKLGLIK